MCVLDELGEHENQEDGKKKGENQFNPNQIRNILMGLFFPKEICCIQFDSSQNVSCNWQQIIFRLFISFLNFQGKKEKPIFNEPSFQIKYH